jgi:hypothetical protein
MKPAKSLLLLALFGTSALLHAQKPITIVEDSVSIGNSKYPGMIITIPEVNYEKTLKNWIKELQTRTKSNVVTENGEMSIFGASMKDISQNPINIYSKLINQDSLLKLLVIFELKKDQYIESAPGDIELTAAKAILKQFAIDQYVDFIKDELQVEDKKLKDLNNELSGMQNDKSQMQKSIQSNKTTITEESDNIVLQKNELDKITAELLVQNDQLTSMEAGAAKEEKASYIKELEQRKKKLLNSVESSENKINKANSEIIQADSDISRNESGQETMMEKIAHQETIVQKNTDRLKTVKAY